MRSLANRKTSRSLLGSKTRSQWSRISCKTCQWYFFFSSQAGLVSGIFFVAKRDLYGSSSQAGLVSGIFFNFFSRKTRSLWLLISYIYIESVSDILCMYVSCMYDVCMYVYTYVYIYTYIHTYIHSYSSHADCQWYSI